MPINYNFKSKTKKKDVVIGKKKSSIGPSNETKQNIMRGKKNG